jgi:hypothetical protein
MLDRSKGFVCAGLLSAVCAVGGVTGFAARVRADDASAVDQIVDVLKQKGLIDEATGDEILAKQAKTQAQAAQAAKATPAVAQGLLDGFVFSGDLRLRDEQFWYGRAFGDAANDNNRLRYRARIGFTKQVNPWALIGVRVVTGAGDYRSTNVSTGQNPDFSYDGIFFDRVYATFTLPDPGIGLATSVTVGKMNNPFTWKNGVDRMIWDDDITPEGVSFTSSVSPAEGTKLWVNGGYFFELQSGSHADAKVWAGQLGGSTKLFGVAELGMRASYYDWRNLQNDSGTSGFFARSAALGNLPSMFDPGTRLFESSAYLTVSAIPAWPATVWGTFIQNLEADRAVVAGIPIGAEDNAWGAGIETGDPKIWARLGVAYHHVEANSVPALYTDSDLFDGLTNRQGWMVYGARELATNTELRLTLFDEHPIKTTASGAGGGPFNISTGTDHQANRRRLQADVNFKF